MKIKKLINLHSIKDVVLWIATFANPENLTPDEVYRTIQKYGVEHFSNSEFRIIDRSFRTGVTVYRCSEEKEEGPKTFYITGNGDDGNIKLHTDPDWERDDDSFFNKLSKAICFDDLTFEEVTFICYKGHEIKYSGWQPGMLFEYLDESNDTIWSNAFPEWEH